jgi:hypothetical protein
LFFKLFEDKELFHVILVSHVGHTRQVHIHVICL